MPNYIDKITNANNVETAEIRDKALTALETAANAGKLVGISGDQTLTAVDKEIFVAIYGTTTYADILAAYEAGKAVYATKTTSIALNNTVLYYTLPLVYIGKSDSTSGNAKRAVFKGFQENSPINNGTMISWTVNSNNVWSQNSENYDLTAGYGIISRLDDDGTPWINVTQVNGIVKSATDGTLSAAVAGTDYVVPSGNITGTAGGLSATLGVSKGGTGKTSVTKNAILAGNASSTTGALAAIATASGALFATAANGTASFGTLPVAQGGTGATTAADALTNIGAAAASHTHAAGDITSGTLAVARGGTGNTSVDTAPTSNSTKMVTSGGLYTTFSNKLGRTSNITAEGAVGTKMVRAIYAGTSDMTAGSTELTTGTIYLVYEE